MTDTPKTKITINGQEVSLEHVPELLHPFVQDADGNGIPDVMDKLFKNPLFSRVLGSNLDQLKSKLKDLTPEQQAKIGHLMEKLTGMAGASAQPSSFTVSTEAPIISTTSTFKPTSDPQIDYGKLGIPDPEQKDSFGRLFLAALIGGALVFGVLWLMNGRV